MSRRHRAVSSQWMMRIRMTRVAGAGRRALMLAFTLLVGRFTPASAQEAAARVPFAVGEVLNYRATFGGVRAGTARLAVESIDTIRGRPAWHIVLTVEGTIPLLRVHDRYETWLD